MECKSVIIFGSPQISEGTQQPLWASINNSQHQTQWATESERKRDESLFLYLAFESVIDV